MFPRPKTDIGSTQKKRTKKNQSTPRTSPAETAYLIGPGCMKVRGGLPFWKPVQGTATKLHPEYLKRIVVFGLADFSGKVFSLLWRRKIQVVFLSPHGNDLLAHLHPAGDRPALARLQHLAAANSRFSLNISKSLIAEKINATRDSLRYYQQQSAISNAGNTLKQLDKLKAQSQSAKSVAALLGIEGSAARLWREQFGRLLPDGWTFTKRKSRPATDPVNAILSLGYMLLFEQEFIKESKRSSWRQQTERRIQSWSRQISQYSR